MSNLIVKKAIEDQEKEAIYNLRYRIYVQEMQRKQFYADHDKKRVKEPLDEHGHLFYALMDDQYIGTIRVNLKREGELENEELYDLDLFRPFYPDYVSMTTKYMVLPEYRGNPFVASQLALAAFHHIRQNGILIDFIDTNAYLIRLYEQMGYRRYKNNINHPEYGYVTPMCFLFDDLDYLKSIKSPFYLVAKEYVSDEKSSTAAFFAQKFPKYAKIKPMVSLSEDDLWKDLSEDLSKNPKDVLSILRGFDDEESKHLLSFSDVIFSQPGDKIISAGEESTGMFCIIDGRVEVQVYIGNNPITIALLEKGDIFGEMGFVSKSKRTADIIASEECKILVLSTSLLKKIEKKYPNIAIKLLFNLSQILTSRLTITTQSLVNSKNQVMNYEKQRQELAEKEERIIQKMDKAVQEQDFFLEITQSPDAKKELQSFFSGETLIDQLKHQSLFQFMMEAPVLQSFGLKSNHQVLHVPCHNGFYTRELAKFIKNGNVYGIDNDIRSIGVAKSLREEYIIDNLFFSMEDLSQLKSPSDHFDFVYGHYLMEEVANPLNAIEELKRVLKPGGILTLCDFDHSFLTIYPKTEHIQWMMDFYRKLKQEEHQDVDIGQKLYCYLQQANMVDPNVFIMTLHSHLIGMEAFIRFALNYKIHFLNQREILPRRMEQVQREIEELEKNTQAWGAISVFFASARKL